MKKLLMAILAAGLMPVISAVAQHQDHGGEKAGDGNKPTEAKHVTSQQTCPVMGRAVNPNLYVDYEGKRIYVCCQGCIAAVQKDPQKYIDKLKANGVTVAKTQTICPVMGGKVNKSLYVDYQGKRIYVCCQGCIDTVKAAPEKYINKLEGEGVALDPAEKPADNKMEHPKHEDQ